MQRLILRVPGLAWLDHFSLNDIVPYVETPSLNLLLNQASVSYENKSLSVFDTSPWGEEQSVLSALVIENSDLPDIKDKQWLIADPCHLRLDRESVLLSDVGVMSLNMDEVNALIASLNAYFQEEGWFWYADRPDRWFVAVPVLTQVNLVPTEDVVGSNMLEAMPQGEDQIFWHKKLTEIQMLLFDHPVNQARESRGELPINGIWVWGDRSLSNPVLRSQMSNRLNATIVLSDLPSTNLACQLLGIQVFPMPYDWSALVAEVDLAIGSQQCVVIELDTMLGPAQYRDAYGWKQSIEDLEIRWFKPILQALYSGQLKHLEMQAHGDFGFSASVSRWHLWRFWRTLKPLHQIFLSLPSRAKRR